MSYKLYIDKNENFECEVSVKNASLKNSIARLIVESSDGPCLVFNGELDGDKCIIPIKRLKGVLDENTHGNMHLEVIVEDTYFKPWQSDFIVEEHTSVKVRVNDNKTKSNRPIVEVKVNPLSKHINKNPRTSQPKIKRKGINVYIPKKEIGMICEQFGIKRKNLHKKHKEFIQVLKEYFTANPEYNYHKKSILRGITNFLR